MSFRLVVPIHFRLACSGDLRALEWMGLHTREREIIAATFAAQNAGEALMLIADANGYPVGQAWLDFRRRGSPTSPRLWALRVFPPLQRAGLGRRLMEEAEARAAGAGAQRLELGVEWENAGARRFYARLGYRPVGRERETVHFHFEGDPQAMNIDQEILSKPLDTTRGHADASGGGAAFPGDCPRP